MKIRDILLGATAASMLALASGAAHAAVEVLNFAGLDGNDEETVLNYYDGGMGGLGSGPGPNYGITFSPNALACSGQPGGTCNTGEIPGGPGANTLFFLDGAAATMDVAGGFTTGFSFDYSAINNPGTINVWSGLDDTGTLLATLNLPVTPSTGEAGCAGGGFCPYVPIDVAFSGTAMSVDFGGDENQVAFANVTLGSTIPGGVSAAPEPSIWMLMIAGVAMIGAALRLGRKRVSLLSVA